MRNKPGYYAFLSFNAPLSEGRADRLAGTLAATAPRDVLDLGCGWGEVLSRVLVAAPAATGRGVDIDATGLARGRENARNRGLADRVEFVEADVSGVQDSADVVICIGSSHAFGGTSAALAAARQLVRPGGRVLFGEQFWERVPTTAEAARFGSTPDECTDLADLVEAAIAAGFRPLRIESANRDEWEAFESGFLADWEDWLLRYGNQPDADEMRTRADEHREQWLRGYRDVLGFAYLTLGAPKWETAE